MQIPSKLSIKLIQNWFKVHVRWSYTLKKLCCGRGWSSLLIGRRVYPTERRGLNALKGFNRFVSKNDARCMRATWTHHFKSLLIFMDCCSYDVTNEASAAANIWPANLCLSNFSFKSVRYAWIKNSQTLHLFHFEPSSTQIR